MNLRLVLACLCSLTAYAPLALADDGTESNAASAEKAESDDGASDSESDASGAEEPYSEVQKWKTFGVGLGARRGPIAGFAGWWGDLLLSLRTSSGDTVGFRLELDVGMARLAHDNDLALGTLTESPVTHNSETLNLYSGLARPALEIPVMPFTLRFGGAVGAATGSYHSSVDSCGDDDWSRAIYGGGADATLGLGNPVFLEPFVRFDVLYVDYPECHEGVPVSEGSSMLTRPSEQYSGSTALFVGAGLMLAL